MTGLCMTPRNLFCMRVPQRGVVWSHSAQANATTVPNETGGPSTADRIESLPLLVAELELETAERRRKVHCRVEQGAHAIAGGVEPLDRRWRGIPGASRRKVSRQIGRQALQHDEAGALFR